MEKLLFGFTFLFGLIRLLTWTKIFDTRIGGIIDTFTRVELTLFWSTVDYIIFFGSLIYQTIYWLY